MEVYSQERLNHLIEDAILNHEKISEGELYKNIGISLIAMGMEAETDPASGYFLKSVQGVDFKVTPFKSNRLLINMQSNEIHPDNATGKGKEFWDVFKAKATEIICGNEGILELIKEAKVKEALLVSIPPLLISMGLTTLYIPVIASLVTGLLMLLIRTGLETFCELSQQ